MYVIKNAYTFFGTSLHGIITAMSFGVPHFGLNKSIKKLDSFLRDWSVAPFNQCYDAYEMSSLISSFNLKNVVVLKEKSAIIIDAVKANNDSILKCIIDV
jgi:polysaccharide pyruvyl transferase WcaK-like protein